MQWSTTPILRRGPPGSAWRPALPANGDANGDGAVDGADFLAWQQNYGWSPLNAGGGGAVERRVPEPSSRRSRFALSWD